MMSVHEVSFVLQMALFCCIFSASNAEECGRIAKDTVNPDGGLKTIIDNVNAEIKRLSNRADFYNDVQAGNYKDDLIDVTFSGTKLDADIDPKTCLTYTCWTKGGTDLKYAVVAKRMKDDSFGLITMSASVTAKRKNMKDPCNLTLGFNVKLAPVKKKLTPSDAEATLLVQPHVTVLLNLPDPLPKACEPLKGDDKTDLNSARAIVLVAAKRSLAYLFQLQAVHVTAVFKDVLHLTKP